MEMVILKWTHGEAYLICSSNLVLLQLNLDE